jgi:putative DNA primase/helicase
MLIRLIESQYDHAGTPHELSFADLVAMLSEYRRTDCEPHVAYNAESPVKCTARAGPAFVPVRLGEGGKVNNAGVAALTVFVADIDHVTKARLGELGRRLRDSGYEFFLGSTHSHDPDRDDWCMRLVMPLSREVPRTDILRFRAALCERLGIPADDRTRDVCRLYYRPSAPARGPEPRIGHAQGRVIDVDEVLASAPDVPLPEEKPAALPTPAPGEFPTEYERAAAVQALRDAMGTAGSPESRALMRKVLAGEDVLGPPGGHDDAINRVARIMAGIAANVDLRLDVGELVDVAGASFDVSSWAGPDDLRAYAGLKFDRHLKAYRGIVVAERERKDRERQKMLERLGTSPALVPGAPAAGETEEPVDDPTIPVKEPLNVARLFLRSRVNAEGIPDLIRWQGEFLRARGPAYETVNSELVVKALYDWADRRQDERGEPVTPAKSWIEDVLHALRAAAAVDVQGTPAWLNGTGSEPPADEILALQNGLLHLPSRQLMPHTRRFFTQNALSFGFAPDAPPPALWLEFVRQLWGDDVESIETLQEIFGLALTDDTSHQKLFMVIGPKRSGKGTIARVLSMLVGPANMSAPTLTTLGQHFGLASLIAKRVAIISDARLNSRADISVIAENLLRISGEDVISVPRKHKEDYTARLTTRFLILSNETPALADSSGALAGRFVVLQLTRSFYGSEDHGLTRKLEAELPGILLWALAGLDRLRARGYFRMPKSAADAVQQMAELGSPIKSFVEDRCVMEPGASVLVDDLYRDWQSWALNQGREHAGTKAILSRNLRSAYPELSTDRPRVVGANGRSAQVTRFWGMRLRNAGE